MRGEASKPRPAVVVQSERVRGENSDTLLVCPFTSDVQHLAFRPLIKPHARNGLTVASEVMVDRLQAATLRRIGRAIGRLTPEEMAEVDAALTLVLGLGATSVRSPR